MDPNMTLRDMYQELSSGDFQEAFYKITSLIVWVERGGFLPDMGLDREGCIAALKNMRRAFKATQG